MNAYAAAAADGREHELHAELEALFNEQNASGSDETTSIPATFLRVTVVGLSTFRRGPGAAASGP